MSKSYKKKRVKDAEEIKEVDESTLSKKELYDLNKKKRDALKLKEEKKKKNNKAKANRSGKTYQTNLAGRIFAIVMLVLMVGSVIATIAAYVR